jgi:hypothetical protein
VSRLWSSLEAGSHASGLSMHEVISRYLEAQMRDVLAELRGEPVRPF